MIRFEEIIKKLESLDIKYERTTLSNKELFKRVIDFSVLGINYRIIWFSNTATLTRDGMFVHFDDIKLNGNLAHKYKTYLVFIEDENVKCSIPCEEYQDATQMEGV